MRPAALAIALYAFASSTYASSTVAPDCVGKCWLNSQYVSLSCAADTKCLCEDSEFQTAVFQCLYSQCPTSKFGTALHHALGYCAGHELDALVPSPVRAAEPSPAPTAQPAPALLRTEGLRKRAGNLHLTKSVTKTHHHQSVSASAYRTHATARAVVREMDDGQVYARRESNAAPAAPPIAAYRMANDRHYKINEELVNRDL